MGWELNRCCECGVQLAPDDFDGICSACDVEDEPPPARCAVSLFFRWYDLWVGAYIDTKNRTIYICPLPMVGVKVQW